MEFHVKSFEGAASVEVMVTYPLFFNLYLFVLLLFLFAVAAT